MGTRLYVVWPSLTFPVNWEKIWLSGGIETGQLDRLGCMPPTTCEEKAVATVLPPKSSLWTAKDYHAPCSDQPTPTLMVWWAGNMAMKSEVERDSWTIVWCASLFLQCLPLELQGHRWEQQSSLSLSPLTPLPSHLFLPSTMSAMVQYWQWTSTHRRGCVLLASLILGLYSYKLKIWY